MATNFGLDKTGFLAPTYEEVLEDVQDDFKQRFGDDIVLTSNSNFGILAEIFAWRLTLGYQEAQKTYYSGFVSVATDTALDRLGANYGVARKVAMPSTAEIVITTSDEYLIEAGEQFETDDGLIFDLVSDVTTVKQSDGTYQGTGTVQSEETGSEMNVKANSITIVSNPDEDIISVTNPADAGGGEDYEEDAEFRERIIEETEASPNSPTFKGIKSALMELQGVRDVGFVQNSTGQTDSYGNPPYTVHIFVLGGVKDEILQTLANCVSAGCILTGSISQEIKDDDGNVMKVAFDFAKDVPIYVKVDISTNSDWNSDTGVDDIKDAIIENISSVDMGKKLYLTKLYPDVYEVSGVEDATIQIGTAQGQLDTKDIALNQFDVATTDYDQIEVSVNGL